IRHERKRPDAALVVASLAARLEDPHDVFIEGHPRRRIGPPRRKHSGPAFSLDVRGHGLGKEDGSPEKGRRSRRGKTPSNSREAPGHRSNHTTSAKPRQLMTRHEGRQCCNCRGIATLARGARSLPNEQRGAGGASPSPTNSEK